MARPRTPKTVGVDELFARNLRQQREVSGMSQPQLAEEATRYGAPLDRVAILKIERAGRPDAKGVTRKVSLNEALALALALGDVSPALLLTPADGEVLHLGNGPGFDGPGVIRWFTSETQAETLLREGNEMLQQLKDTQTAIDAEMEVVKRGMAELRDSEQELTRRLRRRPSGDR
jgi:hypothetical protein